MASNLDIEMVLARMGMNLVFTRVSGIFRLSTSFPCYESFSAPLGARKCLSPAILSLAVFHAGRVSPSLHSAITLKSILETAS